MPTQMAHYQKTITSFAYKYRVSEELLGNILILVDQSI
jgi:hypothetical protein